MTPRASPPPPSDSPSPQPHPRPLPRSLPTGAPEPAAPEPGTPAARVRFGTSSFSSADWVGPFYPPGTPATDFLTEYAKRFDTVEVDSTYYRVPSRRTVDGWVAKTPPEFLLTAKFPRDVVHGGTEARPDPRLALDPDATYEIRDRFLEVMRRAGPRLGPLVLQFPYFNREAFPSGGPFLERLDRFLADLPREGLRYGVEVRNRAWVGPRLRDLLARHDVSLVLVDQAWMPHADEVEAKLDPVTAEPVYVRLLGDRQAIEKITTTWEKEVIDQEERLLRWAGFLARMAVRGVRTLVYANNHYAGHGPATARRLQALFRARLEEAAPPS